jgi:hypothetical protein
VRKIQSVGIFQLKNAVGRNIFQVETSVSTDIPVEKNPSVGDIFQRERVIQ